MQRFRTGAECAVRGAQAIEQRQPVISVDTKKKELVGDFKNAGTEWRPKGEPYPMPPL